MHTYTPNTHTQKKNEKKSKNRSKKKINIKKTKNIQIKKNTTQKKKHIRWMGSVLKHHPKKSLTIFYF